MERTFEEEVLERMGRIEEHLKAKAELCDIHKAELHAVKKDIDGNGKKGIKQELVDLKNEFTRFETKVLAYATIGSGIGGIIVGIIIKRYG